MRKVIITVQTTPQQFPVTTVPAGISVTLGTFEPVVVNKAPYLVIFNEVPEGEYTITAQAIDAEGLPLGEAIETTITVAPNFINVDIPSSISVEIV